MTGRNSIEKLGIKLNSDGCHQFKSEAIYKLVRDSAPEMLEALIEAYDCVDCEDWRLPKEITDKWLNIIQKATGKSWNEIKELINAQ